jgi:hypothetical protein
LATRCGRFELGIAQALPRTPFFENLPQPRRP